MRPKHSERCASSIDGSLVFGRRVSKPYRTLQAASQSNWKILAKGSSRRPLSFWWAETINLR